MQPIDVGDFIQSGWPQIYPERFWGKPGVETFKTGAKYYQMVYKPLATAKSTDKKLMILCITDVSSSEAVRAKYEGSLPVLAYIQIDNYSDVLKGLNESQRSSILSEVNKHLVDWGGEVGGLY